VLRGSAESASFLAASEASGRLPLFPPYVSALKMRWPPGQEMLTSTPGVAEVVVMTTSLCSLSRRAESIRSVAECLDSDQTREPTRPRRTFAAKSIAVERTVSPSPVFRNGCQGGAWLGLVPRQHSSGGKTRLSRITRRGDGYLRSLLVHGARAVIRTAARHLPPLVEFMPALLAFVDVTRVCPIVREWRPKSVSRSGVLGLAAGFLTFVRMAASYLGHHYMIKRSESDIFVT
jgi:hypothetical protein